MGYVLEAVIGRRALLAAATRAQPAAVVVPLAQDMALIPMTDNLFDSITDGSAARPLGFWKLPAGFDRTLGAWSGAGPIGYVEAELFGGIGTQRGAVWADGDLVLGPVSFEERSRHRAGAAATTPISLVLARLGVSRGKHVDEFAAVGLPEHRSTEDWTVY